MSDDQLKDLLIQFNANLKLNTELLMQIKPLLTKEFLTDKKKSPNKDFVELISRQDKVI